MMLLIHNYIVHIFRSPSESTPIWVVGPFNLEVHHAIQIATIEFKALIGGPPVYFTGSVDRLDGPDIIN